MKLTFGKHIGEDLVDVPVSYLIWLEQQQWLRAEVRQEVNYEIERRSGDRPGMGRTTQQPLLPGEQPVKKKKVTW